MVAEVIVGEIDGVLRPFGERKRLREHDVTVGERVRPGNLDGQIGDDSERHRVRGTRDALPAGGVVPHDRRLACAEAGQGTGRGIDLAEPGRDEAAVGQVRAELLIEIAHDGGEIRA